MFSSTGSFNDLHQFANIIDHQDQHCYSPLFPFPNSPFVFDNDDDNFIFNETRQEQIHPPPPTPPPPPPLPDSNTRNKTKKQKNVDGGDVKRRGNKDRHSKIYTAQGPRDRRMRLSLQIARKFFDLQDMLGFDKASKTIEWLFSKSKSAIKEVANGASTLSRVLDKSHSDCSSDSEVVSFDSKLTETNREINRGVTKHSRAKKVVKEQKKLVNNDNNVKESRVKARARARERTKEKMKNKSNPNNIELSKLGLRNYHGSRERNLISVNQEVPDRKEDWALGSESVLDFTDQANAFLGFPSTFNPAQNPSAIFIEENPNSNFEATSLYTDQVQNFASIYEENANSLLMSIPNSNFEQIPSSILVQDSQFLENYQFSNCRPVDGNKYNFDRLY